MGENLMELRLVSTSRHLVSGGYVAGIVSGTIGYERTAIWTVPFDLQTEFISHLTRNAYECHIIN